MRTEPFSIKPDHVHFFRYRENAV